MKESDPPVGVVPLLLGPKNATAATGAKWEWVRDWARRLGVPIHTLGRKSFVDAPAFLAAVRARGGHEAMGEPDVPSADPAAEIRARLGLKLRR